MGNRIYVFVDGFLKQVVSNVLVEGYREGHTNWLIGETPTLPNWVAVGGSDTPAGLEDTELAIELNRVAVTHKFTRRRYVARFNITWHPLEPPGLTAITLKEIGLFDAGPIDIENYSLESWEETVWQADHDYKLEGFVVPTAPSNYAYECTQAGKSHLTTEPIWPTVYGDTIVDNEVIWTCVENPPGWRFSGATSVAKSTVCYQGQLSAKVIAGGVESILYQQVSGDISAYKQKRICFWAAIRHDVANKATVYIDDGIGGKNYATIRIYWDTATSKWVKEVPGGTAYHSGTAGRWELLQVERIIDANATKIEFGWSIVAGGGSPYFDWTNLVQQGNLWARSNIDLSKQDGQVLNIIWEISSYIAEEEGEVIRKTFAHEELSVTNAAVVSLTSSVYRPTGETPASYALITVEDAPNRLWMNGGTPSITSGHLTGAGGVIELYSLEDIENFRVIATTRTPSKLKISYSR